MKVQDVKFEPATTIKSFISSTAQTESSYATQSLLVDIATGVLTIDALRFEHCKQRLLYARGYEHCKERRLFRVDMRAIASKAFTRGFSTRP